VRHKWESGKGEWHSSESVAVCIDLGIGEPMRIAGFSTHRRSWPELANSESLPGIPAGFSHLSGRSRRKVQGDEILRGNVYLGDDFAGIIGP